MFERLDSWLIVLMSVSVSGVCAMPPPILEDRRFILFASIKDL
jgi:hypothetical protein